MAAIKTIDHGSKTQVLESGVSPDTPFATIDEDLRILRSKQLEWAQKVPISERIHMLITLQKNLEIFKDEWVEKIS